MGTVIPITTDESNVARAVVESTSSTRIFEMCTSLSYRTALYTKLSNVEFVGIEDRPVGQPSTWRVTSWWWWWWWRSCSVLVSSSWVVENFHQRNLVQIPQVLVLYRSTSYVSFLGPSFSNCKSLSAAYAVSSLHGFNFVASARPLCSREILSFKLKIFERCQNF